MKRYIHIVLLLIMAWFFIAPNRVPEYQFNERSTTKRFGEDGNLATGTPNLLSPLNTTPAIIDTTTLKWNKMANVGTTVVTYTVYCDTLVDPVTKRIEGSTDTTVALTALRYDATYYWKVVPSLGMASTKWTFLTWRPSDADSLMIWIRPDYGYTFQDTAGTTPAVDGQTLGRVNSRVGTYYWKQPTASQRPLLVDSVQNGKNGFLNDGAGDNLVANAYNTANGETVFQVFKLVTLSSTLRIIWGNGDGIPKGWTQWTSGTSPNGEYWIGVASTAVVQHSNLETGVVRYNAFISNGTTGTVWDQGVKHTFTKTLAPGSTLERYFPTSTGTTAYWLETIVTTDKKTDAEYALFEKYLKDRYAL